MKKITLTFKKQITTEDLEYLLDSASRGSTYWCDSGKLAWSEETKKAITSKVVLKDLEEDKNHVLTLNKMIKGISVMFEKYPEHFADFHSGHDDNVTADVFLQCSLFGEVIYG